MLMFVTPSVTTGDRAEGIMAGVAGGAVISLEDFRRANLWRLDESRAILRSGAGDKQFRQSADLLDWADSRQRLRSRR